MPASLRTFLGVRIAASPAVEALLRAMRPLGRGLSLTTVDKLHLTLKFLGDTPESQLPDILREMTAAAATVGAHTVSLTGLGAFPNAQRPHVVWIGISPADVLERLAGELDRRLEPLGFAPEARPFHPHLTVARIRDVSVPGLRELLIAESSTVFGEASMARLELFESRLGPLGSSYISRGAAMLAE